MKKFFTLLCLLMLTMSAWAETYTVRFQNDASWETVYVYIWGESGTPLYDWPGATMTADGEGEYVYTFESEIVPEGLLFTDGTTQTSDLPFDNNGVYNSHGIIEGSLILVAEQIAETHLDGVARGKLVDAINYAKENDDDSQLQAAIDQFFADNEDQEKDETAKVSVDYTKWAGASGFATWAAPQVTTYDGRTTYVVENYNGSSGSVTGEIFSQTITGLSTGSYKVAFFANANSTAERDAAVETGMADGADDVAYVFANDAQKFLVAHRALSITQNDEYEFVMGLTEADNGTIKLGMGKAKAGTNWHTMQIKQLTWFASAKEVYNKEAGELLEMLNKARELCANTSKNGREELMAAMAPAYDVEDNWSWYNIPEVEAIMANLKQAIADFIAANYFIDFAAGQYYIMDAETGLMLAAGHDWGTRAIVNETGLDITLTPNQETRRVTFDSRVSNGGDSHFLGTNLYMDSGAYGWALDDQGSGFFYITNGTQYLNFDGDNNIVLSDTPREWIIISADGYKAERLEELADASQSDPQDATFLITAPNFNRNDQRNEAWTVTMGQTGEGHSYNISGGNNVNNCAEVLHSDFTISQILSNAPKGSYQLTAQGFYRQDESAEEDAPVFFIGDATAEVPVKTGSENDMATASEAFTNGDYAIDPITFFYDGESDLTVGIMGTGVNQWVCFDNFQLTFLGEEQPVEPETWTIEGQFYDMSSGMQNVLGEAKVLIDGITVTVQGLSYTYPDAVVTGTLDPETGIVTFPSPQQVGTNADDKPVYLVGSDTGSDVNDITFQYDADAQKMTNVSMFILETTNATSALDSYSGFWFEVVLTAGEPPVIEPIVAPDDLVTEPYIISGYRDGTEYTYDMEVGFYGDDVYFKGFTGQDDAPFWAKGTMSADGLTVTIPANQFLGTWEFSYAGYTFSYDFYITAVDDENNLEDIVFNYDEKTGTFTTDQKLALNTNRTKLQSLYDFTNVVITKVNMNAATPADPEIDGFYGNSTDPNVQFWVISTDVEGNELNQADLYYTIWIEKDGVEQMLTLTAELYADDFDEDVVEIPFTYSGYDVFAKGSLVYLKQGIDELKTWTKIGVQTIYYEGEKVGKSNIVWMDLTEYWADSIEDIVNEKAHGQYYDLQGRRVVAPTKGMYIINGKKVLLK